MTSHITQQHVGNNETNTNILASIQRFLLCPECNVGELRISDNQCYCDGCKSIFQISFGRIVLLKRDNQLFKSNSYTKAPVKELNEHFFRRLIPSASINLSRTKSLSLLSDKIKTKKNPTILVIGGGRQKAELNKLLRVSKDSQINLIYTDIDASAEVEIFCDAHDLPFKDGVFDAVITTAVLEHVVSPERVAREITRVVKCDGFLYSELPFMQQVHEGAYDFTRYTLSGHRRLFNAFQEIDSGLVAGPSTALVWAIENFALAFARSTVFRRLTKAFVRLAFGWIKYLDHLLVNRPEAMDGASCTYFFGFKSDTSVDDSEIIAKYVGAKHLTHT